MVLRQGGAGPAREVVTGPGQGKFVAGMGLDGVRVWRWEALDLSLSLRR